MLDPINRLDFFKTTVAFYAILYQTKSNEKKMLQLFFN